MLSLALEKTLAGGGQAFGRRLQGLSGAGITTPCRLGPLIWHSLTTLFFFLFSFLSVVRGFADSTVGLRLVVSPHGFLRNAAASGWPGAEAGPAGRAGVSCVCFLQCPGRNAVEGWLCCLRVVRALLLPLVLAASGVPVPLTAPAGAPLPGELADGSRAQPRSGAQEMFSFSLSTSGRRGPRLSLCS